MRRGESTISTAESASREPPDPALPYFERGRAAWPALALEWAAFESYFAGHARLRAPPPPVIHAADMYLACACAHGVQGALDAFERTYAGKVSRAVKSIDASPAFVDDVLQSMRERLLVREGSRPSHIAEYAGRASLTSWLCTVALRLAISRRRRKGEQGHDPFTAEDDSRLTEAGPEFAYLRSRYKHIFEEAVRAAIEHLPGKQRLLLRLNLVDGMSIDTLASVYKVGRSTAARWLQEARHALLREARCEVHARLGLTSTELDSLAVDIRSDLEVSILGLLAKAEGAQTEGEDA